MSTGMYISGTEKAAAFRASEIAAIERERMNFRMLAFSGLASISGRTLMFFASWSAVGSLSEWWFFAPSFGINALICFITFG